ncbi:alpha/beta fold hydrolase [Actinoallomurus sp. CA-142502]|uniref:alpha/beta fold hydrolase n=1 Tax=Actinoallomurus sp. CA-142502 TaxID=3239885 RepID=UPI003D8B3D5A
MTATSTDAVRTSDVPLKDAFSTRVYETGEPGRPAVLLLHGSGPGVSGLSNWREVITTLADRFHCVAPDIIGFGDSTHPDPAPQGFLANAELRVPKLIELLDALGIDKVSLVGNSMGGMYSLRLVQLAPERVDKVVLMGSGGMPGLKPTPDLVKLITFYDDPTREAMADLFRAFVHDVGSFGADIDAIAEQRLTVASRPEVRRSHLGTFAPGPMLTFSPEELAAITHKTLVIQGREDRIVPLEASHYLARHIPAADLYVMAKCGHWSQFEQAALFSKVIGDFLSGSLGDGTTP